MLRGYFMRPKRAALVALLREAADDAERAEGLPAHELHLLSVERRAVAVLLWVCGAVCVAVLVF